MSHCQKSWFRSSALGIPEFNNLSDLFLAYPLLLQPVSVVPITSHFSLELFTLFHTALHFCTYFFLHSVFHKCLWLFPLFLSPNSLCCLRFPLLCLKNFLLQSSKADEFWFLWTMGKTKGLWFVFTGENTKQNERKPWQRGQAYIFLVQRVAEKTHASQ